VFFQPTQGIAEAIIYLSTLGAGVIGGETVFPVALDPQVEGRKMMGLTWLNQKKMGVNHV